MHSRDATTEDRQDFRFKCRIGDCRSCGGPGGVGY